MTNPFMGAYQGTTTTTRNGDSPVDRDPILGDALEAMGAPVPTGARPGKQTPRIGTFPILADPSLIWCLGVHGGAGTSTLCRIAEQRGVRMQDSRYWPRPTDASTVSVVLAARTNAAGLEGTRRAATEWAAEYVPWVHLLGVVLVADAPKPPAGLRPRIEEVSAMVPHTWSIGWHESWRILTPAETYPLDTRTKHTIGRIKKLAAKTTAPARGSNTHSPSPTEGDHR